MCGWWWRGLFLIKMRYQMIPSPPRFLPPLGHRYVNAACMQATPMPASPPPAAAIRGTKYTTWKTAKGGRRTSWGAGGGALAAKGGDDRSTGVSVAKGVWACGRGEKWRAAPAHGGAARSETPWLSSSKRAVSGLGARTTGKERNEGLTGRVGSKGRGKRRAGGRGGNRMPGRQAVAGSGGWMGDGRMGEWGDGEWKRRQRWAFPSPL